MTVLGTEMLMMMSTGRTRDYQETGLVNTLPLKTKFVLAFHPGQEIKTPIE